MVRTSYTQHVAIQPKPTPRIPRGIARDPKVYHEPSVFKPERFVRDETNPDAADEPDPRLIAFGYGRRYVTLAFSYLDPSCLTFVQISRVCPGRDFAEKAFYMAVVSLLATTTISKALDDQGNEITPELNFIEGTVR